MTAQAAYTAHVVRGACCTGGRLCPTGRVLLLGAKAEEARTEYMHRAEWVTAADSVMRKFTASPHFEYWWHRAALEADAASISLDLAAAEAAVERTRLGVA